MAAHIVPDTVGLSGFVRPGGVSAITVHSLRGATTTTTTGPVGGFAGLDRVTGTAFIRVQYGATADGHWGGAQETPGRHSTVARGLRKEGGGGALYNT